MRRRALLSLLTHLHSSVRLKLALLVMLPLIAVLGALTGLALYWGNAAYHRLVIFKINSDLAVAREYSGRVRDGIGSRVAGLAGSARLAAAMANPHARSLSRKPSLPTPDHVGGRLSPEGERRLELPPVPQGEADGQPEALRRFLAAAQTENKLDFLNLLDTAGNLVASGSDLALPADYSRWPVVHKALGGEADTAMDVFAPEVLSDLDVRLRERALIPLVPTRDAPPTERSREERGLVIHSAAPVLDREGQPVGVLQGGQLLNRNLAFVDTINTLIYGDGSLPEGSGGTATLFLDDVRIATNVRLFEGERALGTRVSRDVREKVLGRGEEWLDRAFVVNDWYVSGYEPIVDSFGKRVGMLYVGFLETPFETAKERAIMAAIVAFLVLSGLASALGLRWARRIFGPLERMDRTMSALEAGEAGARVGPVESRDEIGRLAAHFDQLLDTLERRNRELQLWADELDAKVAARTRELEEANRGLLEAQRQLVMSEKLAALGQLTAGVAHEINNPVAMIQGNLDLVKEVLGAAVQPVAEEVRLIHQQANRIREIVTRLLQFARPAEYAGYVEEVDVNAAVAECLLLVKHLTAKQGIQVVQDCRATRCAGISRSELQQVIVNLLVNAVHAMPEGGTLTVATRDWDGKGVVASVRDTGTGIRQEDLPRIFDPFFTTKKQQGTGLGLSISYALVERYGGTISVESVWRQGAEFSVWLLTEPEFRDQAAAGPLV